MMTLGGQKISRPKSQQVQHHPCIKRNVICIREESEEILDIVNSNVWQTKETEHHIIFYGPKCDNILLQLTKLTMNLLRRILSTQATTPTL